jgi:DNA polymerase IV
MQTESHTSEELPESILPLDSPGSVERVKDSFLAFSPKKNMGSKATNKSDGNDALSEAIKEALATAHLPLDDEEDLISPVTSMHHDDTDTDEEPLESVSKASPRAGLVSKASALRDKKGPNQNQFQCMEPSRGVTSIRNPNAHTIQILEEMGRYYDQIQDTWRTLAYRKAVTTLKKQTVKVNTAAQAGSLPFIGSRLADKIEEIVLTHHLRKLDETRTDPLDACLRLFLGIYGVGIVQANKWVSLGYRSLEDLQNKAKLSESQKIGIEHYTDFNSRIPRSEVAKHGALVQAALRKLDPSFEATVMGSYRRGAKDSGDIDMIITRPGAPLSTLRTTVFEKLIPHLLAVGFLKASLASRSSNDSTGSKWHGASCLPSSTVWRRMDFLLVPEEELGAALIYFTGNDIFNRSIRLLARKKGMRLNQKGLYKDVARGKKGEKLNEGTLVEGKSERRIFEILGVPWREPVERIC